ncbi:hypothetical protein ACP4OV_013439 [Aristida adscensionis]
MAAAVFRAGARRGDAFAALEDAGSATRGRAAGKGGGGGGGGGGARRSRSLSRFPPPSPSPEDAPTPSSRFVNKVRGAAAGGPPEISLDDLADEFFRARAESEGDDDDDDDDYREGWCRWLAAGPGSRRPRRGAAAGGGGAAPPRGTPGRRSRRGSASDPCRGGSGMRPWTGVLLWIDTGGVIRINDMEVSRRYGSRGIHTKSINGHGLQNSFHKPSKVNQVLKRSTSQKDLFHSRDSCSSHSSITDDESRSSHSLHSKNQKAVRADYALDKERQIGDEDGNVLYDVMRKEVRQAVEEIRTQLEKAVTKSEPSEKTIDAQPTQVITELRRSYTSKLEESEQRKQELLAQLAAEEQRGHELTKIVRELLPTSKKNANPERQPRHRRRSNDRSRVSKRLTEEAERYFEDFLSNVDDTDFSSFDGERSDTSLTRKDVSLHAMTETSVMLQQASSPAEADGVVLPWLQWETSNDLQTSPCKIKTQKIPPAARAITASAAVGAGVLVTVIVQRPLKINC